MTKAFQYSTECKHNISKHTRLKLINACIFETYVKLRLKMWEIKLPRSLIFQSFPGEHTPWTRSRSTGASISYTIPWSQPFSE